MSTDDTGTGRGPEDEPIIIGAGLHEVEAQLRTALRQNADAIRPSERLDAILAAAHSGVPLTTDNRPSRRRWLVPAAAAAAAAVVAGALWVSGQPDGPPKVPAITTQSESQSTTVSSSPAAPSSIPTVSGSTSQPVPPTATTPPTVTAPPATAAATLPVYYLGDRTPGGTDLRLFREFVKTTAPTTDAGRAERALELALGAPPAGSGYHAVWQGVTVGDVTVTPSAITVHLSRGLTGVGGESASLGVQQLVWTAQGAVGKGRIPVTFVLDDGGTEVAPGLSTSQPFTQPTGVDALSEIAAVWINEPFRGQQVTAGDAVTVKGVATVFEATVQWQLLRGGAAVDSGFVTASAGAPERGTYTIPLGTLPAGDYTVRAYSTSAKDGSVADEARTTFTVR